MLLVQEHFAAEVFWAPMALPCTSSCYSALWRFFKILSPNSAYRPGWQEWWRTHLSQPGAWDSSKQGEGFSGCFMNKLTNGQMECFLLTRRLSQDV